MSSYKEYPFEDRMEKHSLDGLVYSGFVTTQRTSNQLALEYAELAHWIEQFEEFDLEEVEERFFDYCMTHLAIGFNGGIAVGMASTDTVQVAFYQYCSKFYPEYVDQLLEEYKVLLDIYYKNRS